MTTTATHARKQASSAHCVHSNKHKKRENIRINVNDCKQRFGCQLARRRQTALLQQRRTHTHTLQMTSITNPISRERAHLAAFLRRCVSLCFVSFRLVFAGRCKQLVSVAAEAIFVHRQRKRHSARTHAHTRARTQTRTQFPVCHKQHVQLATS